VKIEEHGMTVGTRGALGRLALLAVMHAACNSGQTALPVSDSGMAVDAPDAGDGGAFTCRSVIDYTTATGALSWTSSDCPNPIKLTRGASPGMDRFSVEDTWGSSTGGAWVLAWIDEPTGALIPGDYVLPTLAVGASLRVTVSGEHQMPFDQDSGVITLTTADFSAPGGPTAHGSVLLSHWQWIGGQASADVRIMF